MEWGGRRDGAGRPRKHARQKQLEGSINITRDGERLEIAFHRIYPPHIPDPPAHLSADERDAWAWWARVLAPYRIVTDADAGIFEVLAFDWWLHQSLTEALRKAKGAQHRELLARLLDRQRRHVELLLSKSFGLSGSLNQYVRVKSGGPEDEFGRDR